MHLSRCDTAKCEPGGKFGGEVGAYHAISGIFVVCHRGGGEQVVYAFMAGSEAAVEGVG